MERAVALTKIRKILGSKFNYRVDPKAPSKDEREAAKVEFLSVKAEYDRIQKELQARREAVLAADAEYRRIGEEYKAITKRRSDLSGKMHSNKISVGVVNGMFNWIKAEGDSWEEVIAKLQKK